MAMPVKSAIVVSGGIGGLSAALQLRRAGLDVPVFEQRASVDCRRSATLRDFER